MTTRRNNTTTYPREKKSYLGKEVNQKQHQPSPERDGEGTHHTHTASPLMEGKAGLSCAQNRGNPRRTSRAAEGPGCTRGREETKNNASFPMQVSW